LSKCDQIKKRITYWVTHSSFSLWYRNKREKKADDIEMVMTFKQETKITYFSFSLRYRNKREKRADDIKMVITFKQETKITYFAFPFLKSKWKISKTTLGHIIWRNGTVCNQIS